MPHNDNSLDETAVMSRVPRDDDTIIMSPLVGRLMEASVQMTHATTNALIDSITYEAAEQRATLELVREAIMEIANRPYVANPFLYLESLHPRRAEVQERMFRNGYKKG